MRVIAIIILSVIFVEMSAVDPNTSPWPASGPIGIGTNNPAGVSQFASLALDKTGNHNYLAINADLAYQSAITFNDRSHGSNIVLYRPPNTRDFEIFTPTVGPVIYIKQTGEVSFLTVPTVTRATIAPLDFRPADDANVWWRMATSSVAHGGGNFTISNLGAGGGDVLIIAPSGECIVKGAAPTTVVAGQVRIGGGEIMAAGNGAFLGDLSIGNGVAGQNHKLVLRGPNTPYDETTHQDVSYEFAGAGSAKIRSYRGVSWDTHLQFLTNGAAAGSDNPTVRMHISESGNVGIGTTMPTNTLTVVGTISAKEIKVTTSGADYVFADGYRLRPLAEVEAFIAAQKHLPEMMPARIMEADGMPVSEVVTKQLAKIEELTLYVIALDRENRRLAAENATMRSEQAAANEALDRRIKALENP
jgi:hypothetical protein